MAINFGQWAPEFALGEKLYAAELRHSGTADDHINDTLNYYKDGPRPESYQRKAKLILEMLGASAGGTSGLFSPLPRTPEVIKRIHDAVLAAGADSGKRDHGPGSYNAAIVPIFVLRHRVTGRYRTMAGLFTENAGDARTFTSRADANKMCSESLEVVEIN